VHGASLHGSSKYKKILEKCKATNAHFVDDEFPAADRSCFYNTNPAPSSKIVWKRIGELCETPCLFGDGASADDIMQGALGDCWFLGSLSVLASNRTYLKQVIPHPKQQEWPKAKKGGEEGAPAPAHPGVFRFRFWKFGEWHEVLVDDQLPTVNGKLLYASSRDRNEWWVPLVEKAYAKLHGSYEALTSGASSEAMVDFTGGFCEVLDLTKPEVVAMTESRELWRKLKVATERKELMSCSSKVSDAPLGRSVSGHGIIINHAYAILEVRTVPLKGLLNLDKIRLLKIRNPWGEVEWNGPWSDNSTEWKSISDRQKKKLGLVISDDGIFWMAYQDFYRVFNNVEIAHTPNTSVLSTRKTWHNYRFLGSWTGSHAGGCTNHETFVNNPQYFFNISDDNTKTIIALMQGDARLKNKSGKDLTIGFSLIRVENNRKQRVHKLDPSKVLKTPTYINSREVTMITHLDYGRYVLIPTTFLPGEQGDYLLRVFTEGGSNCKQIEKDTPENRWFRSDYALGVRVEIQSAIGLRKAGKFENLTYVSARIEGNHEKTLVRKGERPIFNESFIFFVRHPKKATLKLDVWHDSRLGLDDFLGCVRLPIKQLLKDSPYGKSFSLSAPLTKRKKDDAKTVISGSLQIVYMIDDKLNQC